MSRSSPGSPTSPSVPRATAPRPAASRIRSLDVVRGLMLVVSVGVNSLLVTPPRIDHAHWEGVHLVDLVFPVFVTLTGCGLAFALRRRVDVRGLARRVVVLLVAGLAYNAVTSGRTDVATWRVTGVLQLYALVVVVVALGHLLTRTARGWAAIAVLLAAAHSALLLTWARGCPGGVLTRECNPSGVVDTAVFGAAHTYTGGVAGHDPEGLVAVLGACATAAAGAAVGHALLTARDRVRERSGSTPAAARPAAAVVPVLAVVASCAVAALLGHLAGVDAFKRLWTAPFALGVVVGTGTVLLLAHLVLDRPGTSRFLRGAVWPLEALGRNSLLVYFGSHALTAVLVRHEGPDGRDLAERAADAVAVAGSPQLGFTLLLVLGWVLLAAVLHRCRVYLRP